MIRFEWDNVKAHSNRRKHGISFDIAKHIFDDPDALMSRDRIEGGEVRWQTIGTVDGILLLLVAHTIEGEEGNSEETIRIISDRKERERYEKERQKKYS